MYHVGETSVKLYSYDIIICHIWSTYQRILAFSQSVCALDTKIQPNTIDLSMRLWVINPTNSVAILQSLVLRSIVLGWISVYQNWSIFSAFLCNHEFCRYHLSIKTTELFLSCKLKLWHAFPSTLSAKSPCWASKLLSGEELFTN